MPTAGLGHPAVHRRKCEILTVGTSPGRDYQPSDRATPGRRGAASELPAGHVHPRRRRHSGTASRLMTNRPASPGPVPPLIEKSWTKVCLNRCGCIRSRSLVWSALALIRSRARAPRRALHSALLTPPYSARTARQALFWPSGRSRKGRPLCGDCRTEE
jgi:hypothetical protein